MTANNLGLAVEAGGKRYWFECETFEHYADVSTELLLYRAGFALIQGGHPGFLTSARIEHRLPDGTWAAGADVTDRLRGLLQ